MVSRLGPSRTLTERLRQRAAPTTRGAGVRGAGALASRAQGILGGRGRADFSAVGRGFNDMINHPAVGFGRQMTASPAQAQIDQTVGDVRSRLAESGIYKDELGTFQISGMERSDPSRAIRDAAIAAMDPTGEVDRRVAFSESMLNPEGAWARPAPRGTNTAERAFPEISDVLATRVGEIGKPPADISTRPSTPAPTGGLPPGTLPRQVPSPAPKPPQPTSRPGVLPIQPGQTPSTKPPQPNAVVPGSIGTLPGYPNPGTDVSRAAEPGKPPAPTPSPFPPQGQGVGRTTTPTGAEVDPSRYPTTTPGTQTTPAASGFTGNGYANPNSALMQSLNGKPPAPTGGTLPRQEPGKPPAPTPTGGLPPDTLPRQGGTPGTQTTPAAQPGTPGQTPPTPGTTTASRPGGGWPTDKLGPFGTDDGGTSMFPPGFPFNDRQRPGGAQGSALDLSGLGQSIQARVAEALGGNPALRQAPAAGLTPIPGLEGLGDRIRAVVEGGQRDLQSRLAGLGMTGLPGTTPAGQPGGGITPAPAPAPGTAPTAPAGTAPAPGGGASANALGVADMIILQESGGAPATPNNLNCSIRPSAGCLDLNTGIFEVTAREYGLDWNRLVAGDAEYGRQAVAQLMTGYAQDDASKWNGPAGMTVWEYGEQNLPGGGWEAVGRVYFGGDVTGSFVDEQGRSGVTYGQQFVDKLNAAGIPTGPGSQAAPGTTQAAPDGSLPPGTLPSQAAPVTDGSGGVVSPPGSSTAIDSGVADPRGQQVADLADDYVGVDYVWGGIPTVDQDPRATGWDCSGFTRWIADKMGYNVPAGSHYQYQAAVEQGILRDVSTVRPGDLIFFDTTNGRTQNTGGGGAELNNASHVGIYLGDGKFINAAAPGIGTVIYQLDGYSYPIMGVASMYDYR